ncbi:ATP-binding protein [Variovorax sp. J31P207]|uniref:sensor histidine kinase n=1 Tax=Variovorax sp. J31P207 TaxID=3053510 RepID=UPI002574E170|nr:ATP-binding protein [Variovorax sp. J31P207]MDM0065118.1 ATP-binding protein [Variovorax sp. J31P207]
MRRIVVRACRAAIALFCLLMAGAQAAPLRNVLVVFANDRLLPANVEFDRGLREGLALPTGREVALFSEFLDQPVFSGPDFEQAVSAYLLRKYQAQRPDVIVAAGQSALEFFVRHRDLFPGVPVIHVAVGQFALERLKPLPDGFVGSPVAYDYAATIEMAMKLHPQRRHLVTVTGSSPLDLQYEAELREALARITPPPVVESLVGLPTKLVQKRLAELGPGDLVFTPGYFMDGEGHALSPRESVALAAAASKAPVYGPFNTYIGTGLVGGMMPTFKDVGHQAARQIAQLVDGVAPASLSQLPITAQPQFDWRQLRAWDVDEARLPPGAVLHFKDPTFLEAYRNQAVLVAAVILVQAFLIAALMVERRLRRRTASALKQSEQRMHLAARAAGLSNWTWVRGRKQAERRPLVPSLAAHSSIQPFEEFLATVHVADREECSRAVAHALAHKEELDIEYRQLQPDGTLRWTAARGRAVPGDPDRMTGVALDITARKVAQLQAVKDRAALTRMTRISMLGQLSASIAHQLNQPLAAILGNAEAARKMLGRENPDLAELGEICRDIITEDQRATEIIRRLGALFRRGETRFVRLDLNALVGETLELARTELMTRHVVAATELDPLLPPVDGERVQLQQVLLNLVLNAADAMSANDPARRTLTVRTASADGTVRLCVADEGVGIPAEDISRVFDPFWTTKTDGTGVGLAICKTIVAAHRGVLTATNNPQGGSTFCANWPLKQLS